MSRRRRPLDHYGTALSVLDFVTICLGATLLLMVMVPTRKASFASIANQEHALALVREHFANASRRANVQLAEDLIASHPSLPRPSPLAPWQLGGMSLSMLADSQLIRRAELVVQHTGTSSVLEAKMKAAIGVLQTRGIGYLNLRSIAPGASHPAAEAAISRILSKKPSAAALAAGGQAAPPTSAAAALAAAEAARNSSPTPDEAIVVIASDVAGLKLIGEAVGGIGCPKQGLLIVGPALQGPALDPVATVMRECDRADYLVVDG